MRNLIIGLLALPLLTGCASRVPIEIRTPPVPAISPAEVQKQPDAYRGHAVRWGGDILTVETREKETEIEFLAKALDSSGKPEDGDVSLGRFLARVEGFLDPAVYTQGRSATVRGVVEAVTERNIGERAYVYPVVRAHTLYLWPRKVYYGYPRYYPYHYPYGYYRYGLHFGLGHRFGHHGGLHFGYGHRF